MNTKLDKIVERHSEEMISSLKGLLKIPSVGGEPEKDAPYGREVAEALEYVLAEADKLGFKTVNFDGQVGYCEYGRGDVIAVVSHLDVVPAGEGWTHDPFGAEEQNGMIFARGAVDDKGPAMAALYALYALKESHLKIKHKVRLLFGTNEENGSTDMKYYFEHGGETPVAGFTPDGAYPVINGEKGIVISSLKREFSQGDHLPKLISMKGGTAFNVVPAKANAVIECDEQTYQSVLKHAPEYIKATRTQNGAVIEAEGVGAHGSTPERGINAVARLIGVLKELPFERSVSEAFSFLHEKVGSETDGKSLGIALCDSVSGGLVLNMGCLDADEKSITLGFNYRYPVTLSYDDCAPKFNETFAQNGFRLVYQTHEKPLYVDPNGKLVSTLLDVYNDYTQDQARAISIGGGTYAKSVPNIVAFGPVFPGDADREHKPDECIEKDKLILNAKIYASAIYRLAK